MRLSQGVTLGATPVSKDRVAEVRRGPKRHPTIEDDVVICPGATVLGNTTVGRRSVIGANAWVAESIPPDSHVFARATTRVITESHLAQGRPRWVDRQEASAPKASRKGRRGTEGKRVFPSGGIP